MLLIVWGEGSSGRVARDVNLLGFEDHSTTAATTTFRDICGIKVEDDGVEFEIDGVVTEAIRPEQKQSGFQGGG